MLINSRYEAPKRKCERVSVGHNLFDHYLFITYAIHTLEVSQ